MSMTIRRHQKFDIGKAFMRVSASFSVVPVRSLSQVLATGAVDHKLLTMITLCSVLVS